MARVKNNNKWGCIDQNGDIIINNLYDYILIYDNIIFVKQNRKWGIIDQKGKLISLPQFDWVIDITASIHLVEMEFEDPTIVFH